uniref:Receptor protein serine/threonine kinase n=1 Tax=Heterorhabditis bacteriophora TaxID=37862 RepID=A0A1I7X857_HETBA
MTLIPEKVKVQVGTKRYMAPEVIAKTLNASSFIEFKMADMYSYALVMWEIARKVESARTQTQALPCDVVIECNPSLFASNEDKNIPLEGTTASCNNVVYDNIVTSVKLLQLSKAKPYVSPFEGMVNSDPSFDDMRVVVCEKRKRPPIEESWTSGSNDVLLVLFSKIENIAKSIGFRPGEFDGQISLRQKYENCGRQSSTVVSAP